MRICMLLLESAVNVKITRLAIRDQGINLAYILVNIVFPPSSRRSPAIADMQKLGVPFTLKRN